MKKNGSLEFQLFPAPTASSTESSVFPNKSVAYPLERDENTGSIIAHSRRQVCVCDASELQARIILWLARKEMEDKFNYKMGMPSMQVQFHGLYGMSLKKSIRGFLQKRKDRIQSSIPYKQKVINGNLMNGSKLGDN